MARPIKFAELPEVVGVYLMWCTVTGRVYVGASRNIKARARKHRVLMRSGGHSELIQADFNLYGFGAFSFAVAKLTSEDDLLDVERDLIREAAKVGVAYNIQLLPEERVRNKEANRQHVAAYRARLRESGESEVRGIVAANGLHEAIKAAAQKIIAGATPAEDPPT